MVDNAESVDSIYIPLCFYLNEPKKDEGKLPDFNLHSTMFLFKLRQRHLFDVSIKHLHSTMFLFKPTTLSFVLLSFVDLHSTMFLFKHAIYPHWAKWKIYLHSTMFLFKQFPQHQTNLAVYNLHSTMFLFKQYCVIPFSSIYLIYIPLCFYLNDTYDRDGVIIKVIYIPLCFYLNKCSKKKARIYPWFTFHYVSI